MCGWGELDDFATRVGNCMPVAVGVRCCLVVWPGNLCHVDQVRVAVGISRVDAVA